MSTPDTLGGRLRLLRKAQGWTQAQCADRMGVSRSAWQYYERDERDMPSRMLLKICQEFDCDVHQMLAGRPSPLVERMVHEVLDPLGEEADQIKASGFKIPSSAFGRAARKAFGDACQNLKAPPRADMASLLAMVAVKATPSASSGDEL